MVVEATFSGQRVADLAQTERESLVGHDSRARTGPARYALRAVSAEVRSRGEGRRGREEAESEAAEIMTLSQNPTSKSPLMLRLVCIANNDRTHCS